MVFMYFFTENVESMKNVESVVDQNCSGVQSPRLVVKNYGHETVTSFVMRAFDGVNSYSQTWEGSLAEGETVEALMDEFVADKCDVMQFFVEQPNGNDDGFPVDNVISTPLAEPSIIDGALTLQLKTGAHPENVTFEVRNMDTDEVEYSFTYDQPGHVYREEFVLMHEACYRMTVRDAAGEGMGTGIFQVKDSNNQVVFRGGYSDCKFTYEIATELHSDGSVGVEEIEQPSSSTVYKVIENGQLIIIKDGERYNINGQRLK